MLSILIPVYNYNITSLIKTLHEQCTAAGITYEILCFDDASDKQFKVQNKAVSKLDHVTYRELPQNLGRARIRNELGRAAKYNHLLFLDRKSTRLNSSHVKISYA